MVTETVGTNKITGYNHSLYAYTTMLKQFSAKYSDQTLTSASEDIEALYNGLSSIEEINTENVAVVRKSLHTLRLCNLNLQITLCNKGYNDIEPICEALAVFIGGIEQDIKGIGGLNG